MVAGEGEGGAPAEGDSARKSGRLRGIGQAQAEAADAPIANDDPPVATAAQAGALAAPAAATAAAPAPSSAVPPAVLAAARRSSSGGSRGRKRKSSASTVAAAAEAAAPGTAPGEAAVAAPAVPERRSSGREPKPKKNLDYADMTRARAPAPTPPAAGSRAARPSKPKAKVEKGGDSRPRKRSRARAPAGAGLPRAPSSQVPPRDPRRLTAGPGAPVQPPQSEAAAVATAAALLTSASVSRMAAKCITKASMRQTTVEMAKAFMQRHQLTPKALAQELQIKSGDANHWLRGEVAKVSVGDDALTTRLSTYLVGENDFEYFLGTRQARDKMQKSLLRSVDEKYAAFVPMRLHLVERWTKERSMGPAKARIVPLPVPLPPLPGEEDDDGDNGEQKQPEQDDDDDDQDTLGSGPLGDSRASATGAASTDAKTSNGTGPSSSSSSSSSSSAMASAKTSAKTSAKAKPKLKLKKLKPKSKSKSSPGGQMNPRQAIQEWEFYFEVRRLCWLYKDRRSQRKTLDLFCRTHDVVSAGFGALLAGVEARMAVEPDMILPACLLLAATVAFVDHAKNLAGFHSTLPARLFARLMQTWRALFLCFASQRHVNAYVQYPREPNADSSWTTLCDVLVNLDNVLALFRAQAGDLKWPGASVGEICACFEHWYDYFL